MTADYLTGAAANKQAQVNADVAAGYLVGAHNQADPAEASVKAQIDVGYALLANRGRGPRLLGR